MPAVNGRPGAQASPWWTAVRPQTPPTSAAESHLPYLDHAEDGERPDDFPLRSSSRRYPANSRSPSKSRPRELGEAEADLAPLQDREVVKRGDGFDPIADDNPASYDLLAPTQEEARAEYSLERRCQMMLSKEHLQVIFADPSLLFKFTAFLTSQRPQSLPMLVYYLDTLKAIRAIRYADAIARGLDPVAEHDFTSQPISSPTHTSLEQRAQQAFEILVRDDLPAYITSLYIQTVSVSVTRRVTGSLDPRLRDASEGLAEVFCLTDPSKADNPIVFASEEFYRTTQYGMSYVLGRNCRFLQGPSTNADSVRRIRSAITAERPHHEVLLNYRRDGSPFMNLLMTAPLFDSRGQLRYFIGAQVDVSGLVKECAELESLQRLLVLQEKGEAAPHLHLPSDEKRDEFQELCEMFNMSEMATVRKCGGRMHQDSSDDADSISVQSQQPRLLLREPLDSSEYSAAETSGKLAGAYNHFLLVRPYPSLRILFASPSQRLPGILQAPLLDKIGGSARVREELSAALAEGRGVTAKVRWLSRNHEQGRSRWIHCTPLLGINGQIGVWMVVMIDDERQAPWRQWRPAPPVSSSVCRSLPSRHGPATTASINAAAARRGDDGRSVDGRGRDAVSRNGYARSESPSSLRVE